MLTVAVLFCVAAGIQATGGVELLRRLLERIAMRKSGDQRSLSTIILITMAPISALSAFLNNTPVVATGIPLMQSLAPKLKIPASRLLIPLSYAR